ncbi:hypothetical protein [Miltoncostaea marina]|uniref:hypothetical protein n=1 Tax=Miltoncostaea marina TaxID=2843215 RepID=UPI001C3E6F1E|nr:hypothetical protein [Miltoncostaea marina]
MTISTTGTVVAAAAISGTSAVVAGTVTTHAWLEQIPGFVGAAAGAVAEDAVWNMADRIFPLEPVPASVFTVALGAAAWHGIKKRRSDEGQPGG